MHRCGLCMEPSGIPGRAALQRQPTHFSRTTLQPQWFVGRLPLAPDGPRAVRTGPPVSGTWRREASPPTASSEAPVRSPLTRRACGARSLSGPRRPDSRTRGHCDKG